MALAVLAAGSLLWMVACPLSKRLPSPSDVSLQEPLLEAPVQVDGDAPPIPAEKGGIHYTVQPVADYRLVGMVVSRHESDSFADYYHDVWGDNLNVADLCVVWGENLSKGYYRGIEFWSEPFTCNWQTRDEKAWASFRTNEISNNHLIAEDRGLRRRLLSVRVGDVVRIEGQLATYSNDRGFSRGTSRSREDTGNGACETVWVRNVEILRSANRGWILLRWLGGWTAIAGVVLLARWFARRPAFRELDRSCDFPPRHDASPSEAPGRLGGAAAAAAPPGRRRGDYFSRQRSPVVAPSALTGGERRGEGGDASARGGDREGRLEQLPLAPGFAGRPPQELVRLLLEGAIGRGEWSQAASISTSSAPSVRYRLGSRAAPSA